MAKRVLFFVLIVSILFNLLPAQAVSANDVDILWSKCTWELNPLIVALMKFSGVAEINLAYLGENDLYWLKEEIFEVDELFYVIVVKDGETSMTWNDQTVEVEVLPGDLVEILPEDRNRDGFDDLVMRQWRIVNGETQFRLVVLIEG